MEHSADITLRTADDVQNATSWISIIFDQFTWAARITLRTWNCSARFITVSDISAIMDYKRLDAGERFNWFVEMKANRKSSGPRIYFDTAGKARLVSTLKGDAMSRLSILILAAIFFGLDAQALTLAEIQAGPDKALPINVEDPNPIPCGQIATRLEDYNRMARQHDLSVSTFLGEVTGKMLSWYDLLQPLEGTPDSLPIGVFAPLQDGANKITAVTDLAYENSSLLATEMDRIIQSLKECSLTATTP